MFGEEGVSSWRWAEEEPVIQNINIALKLAARGFTVAKVTTLRRTDVVGCAKLGGWVVATSARVLIAVPMLNGFLLGRF